MTDSNTTSEAELRILLKANEIAELFGHDGAERALAVSIVQLVKNERDACLKAVMSATQPGERAGAWYFAAAIRDME